MTDTMTPEQRHRCMAQIHSKGTKPEMKVRRWLWSHGYRYRLNVKSVPGKPDIVMRPYRTAIFVNGCFWHGHNAQIGNPKLKIENSACCKIPTTNREFWVSKIRRNQERDQENYRVLQENGWQVVGIPALLTSLTPDALQQGDLLRLYTLRQTLESQRPMVRIKAADIPLADFQIINGHLTLTDNSFADDMAGWALVHLRPNHTTGNAQPTYRCSSQTVVSRCTYYQRFTTEEALLHAAATYGGLTKEKAV